jgi:XRE family transcriptional regulator, aerobic/anaerobic benzoate catabolism transcriptional regulator
MHDTAFQCPGRHYSSIVSDLAINLKKASQYSDSQSDNEFLFDLGERVRAARATRGMTRKALARDSGVSERYLAQLEAGRGNASILVLRQIAGALHVPIGHLVGDGVRRASGRRDRIALIGLRGAGKSTLGARLAKAIGAPFVELDREVEREAGTPLSEIFLLYGQAGYRRYEKRCLEKVLESNARVVLATGGSIVSEPATFDLLRSECLTVWLKAAPEEHMARVVAQGDTRPMAGSREAMQDLRRILAGRAALYGRADATIDTAGKSIEQSLAELRRAVSANMQESAP